MKLKTPTAKCANELPSGTYFLDKDGDRNLVVGSIVVCFIGTPFLRDLAPDQIAVTRVLPQFNLEAPAHPCSSDLANGTYFIGDGGCVHQRVDGKNICFGVDGPFIRPNTPTVHRILDPSELEVT